MAQLVPNSFACQVSPIVVYPCVLGLVPNLVPSLIPCLVFFFLPFFGPGGDPGNESFRPLHLHSCTVPALLSNLQNTELAFPHFSSDVSFWTCRHSLVKPLQSRPRSGLVIIEELALIYLCR